MVQGRQTAEGGSSDRVKAQANCLSFFICRDKGARHEGTMMMRMRLKLPNFLFGMTKVPGTSSKRMVEAPGTRAQDILRGNSNAQIA